MRTNDQNKATRKSDLTLKKLEDRILFDAALDPGLDPEAANAQAALSGGNESAQSYEQDVATYHDPSEQAADEEQNSATTVRNELVIVDTSVENYQQLVDDLLNNGQEDRELAVVLLDADADGIEQVSQILAQYNDLDAVHLVSHGDTAAFRLGNAWVTADNLEAYAGQVASWGEALNGSGDLLLYGCDLAESAEGRELVDSIAALTGSDVAASDDDTGSATRGGDWALEYRHGTLESSVAFSQSLQSNYRGVLAVGPDVQFASANQDVQLGENFTFTVTFDNTGTDVGYGPFVDLIFPVNGIDGAAGTDTADGIDFAGATYLGQPLNFIEMTFPDDGGGTGTIDHPFAVDATGNPMQITGTTGDKLVVLELPFGSYSPGQPPADLVVSATTSNLADLGSDLIIQSRSGFRYGSDPLDNPTVDPSVVSDATTDVSNPLTGWSEQLTVTPTLMSLTKTYLGPENETATGPNFPHQYRLDVDIADGQTISNLDITDSLPNNIVITSIDSVLVNGVSSPYTDNFGSLTFPGNNLDLIITPTGSVTGTASDTDVSVTFTFYVAEFDADGNRVIPLDGNDDLVASQSMNNARAVGDWNPIDTRDPSGTDNAIADPDSTGPEHILDDKAIAIQKSVAIVSNSGVAGESPGDVLEYTLRFQISDYYTFGDLIIDDTFQDGQLFDFSYGATFDITDANGTVTGSFTVRSITAPDGGETLVVDETQINNADNLGEDGVTPDGSDGSTTLRFDLSKVLVDNGGADGILQGGLTDGATNDGPATGTIRFRTTIQEDYSDTFTSGDRSVDQGDLITNSNLTITGTVRENAEDGSITNVIGTESDNSSASVQIEVATLIKEVYAINGNTVLPTGPSGLTSLTPGDVITYRIEYTLATSDFEDLVITDFLPLPIFDVLDHNADGVVTPADNWTFNVGGSFDASAPASGVIEFGNSDTFYNSNPTDSNIIPTITVDGASNGLMVTFGDYDDPNSLPSTIELYVSLTAQDAPTADGLYLTNIVRAAEGTTQGAPTVTDQIVQIEVLQPELSITKGIVSSDSTSATFDSPFGPAGITFATAGTGGSAFTGVIHSDGLALQGIDANITGGVDAGDTIRYAIVLENTGNSTRGAYDVQLSDALPAGFSLVGGSLQIVDGTGAAVAYTGAEADLFLGGIELNDPGATPDTGDGTDAGGIDGYDATDGRNVVIIFYDVTADATVEAAQTLTNTATLQNYAGLEGGDNHAAAMPTDDASVTFENASANKSIVSTSEAHTTFLSGYERVTIGEIVRYRIQVALPEGSLTNLQIFDVLPGGLTFIDDGTATVALVSDSGSLTSSTLVGVGLNQTGNETNVGTITPTFQLPDDATSLSSTVHNDNYVTGGDVYFKLGNVVNGDSDANVEYAVIEFNALVDNNSTTQNDAGDSRYNDVRVRTNGSQIYDMPNASRPRVIIAEPLVQNINKTGDITSGDAGDTVTYTVTFDVANGDNYSDAFDVRMIDALPAGLNIGSITSILVDGAATTFTDNSVGNVLDVVIDRVNKGQAVEIIYDATLDIGVNPNEMLTNDAQVTWSSLANQFGTDDGTPGNNTGSDLASLNGLDTNDGNGETASIIYDTTSGSLHGKRDGSDGAGVNPNDYADNDTHTVTVAGITTFTKYLISTEFDDAFNGLNDVVVGELVTYELTITFPEGTTPNSVIVDTMDNGLAYVGIVSSSVSDLNITGSTTPTVSGDGRILTFDFGTVTDADLSNDTGGTITLRYEAVVLNVAGNQSGTVLDNNAEFTFDANPATAINTDAPDVTVREAQINVTKSVEISPPSGSTSGDAGDAVQYTIVIQNTGNYDAFDVTFSDSLPLDSGGNSVILGATFNVVDSMPGGLTNADFMLSGDDTTGYTLSLNGATDLDLLKSQGARTITITIDGTVALSVGPSDIYVNTANADWTSLDSVVASRSTHTTDDSGERDGTNAADNTHDYTDSGSASFTIDPPIFTKVLVDTEFNDAYNGLNDVVIGELVTYEVSVTFPEGTTPNAVIIDTLDNGLAFVGMTSATPSDVNITGSTTPVVSGNGRVLTFDFGTVTDADLSNNTGGTITLRYQAVVLNLSGNQSGTALNNTAQFTWNGDPATAMNDDAADVTVREAQINVTKSVEISPPSGSTSGDAGDAVQYTIVIQNTGNYDAFDVAFSDSLPLDSGGNSVILGATFNVVDSMPGGLTNADFMLSGDDTTGYTLSLNGATDLDLLKSQGARTITITIDGTVALSVGPSDIYVNTANADWTSLDSVVASRSTHTTDDSGERDGTNAADNTHDYADSGSASFTIDPPLFSKLLFGTDQTETTGSNVTIGERVTYALLVTLPEGSTAGLDFTDQLPPGLNYENFQLVQTVVGSGGLLTADFNGTIQVGDPVVTGGVSDGDDVTFTFGQIIVANDNDSGNNSFVLLVTAVVSDVGTNVGYNPGQTTLANTATIDIIGDGLGATTSNQVDVDVVESNLVITKDIDKTEADADELLTITLTVENNGLGNAYDVILQDILSSADYDLSSVNLGSSGVDYPADFTASFNPGTGLLEFNGGTINAGATVTFTFTVETSNTVAPGATITNTATITQATTLQGVEAGERNATDPDGDGSDTSQDTFDIRTNSLAGSVYFDADNDGLIDAGESGIANVDVRLQGTDHLGNAVDITVQTAADGSYLFDDLRPGTYSIAETQPITASSGNDYLDGIDAIGTQGGNDSVNDLFFNISLPTGTETHGTDNNFAELEEAELNGFVWHDADNDGVFDAGEQGIGGVDVTLTGTDDLGAITPIIVTTAADGSYTFDGLRPGQYNITQTQPTFVAPSGRDYTDGIDVDGSLANGDTASNDVISSIDVVAADDGTSYNFGEVIESVVSGYVYSDSNNDGSRTAETGIENVTVTLTGTDDLGNAVNLISMTDINGFYEFANLRPSDTNGYTITQTQPASHLDGIDTIGTPGGDDTVNDVYSSITITSDTAGSENNFGELIPAGLGGTVFNDHNNDGIQDAGETGIAGTTITLSGTDDLGNLVNVSVITDVNGNYQFTNVRPSDAAGYTLSETQPTNYNDGLDQDGSLANGDATVNDFVSSINVNSGDNGTGYNFAEQGTSILGTVYVDDDRDGTLDASESNRLGGIAIELWDATGTTLIDSTVTLADGTYRFDNLPADDYQIREIHPAQYSSTSADTVNVTLPLAGLTDQNFGEALWDLGDYVWFDADNDGLQDAGEAGLANVGITLLYAGADGNFATTGDNVTLTTTTDTNGFYSFSELFNGEYQVTVDPADMPSGVTGTFETDDSSIGIDGTSNITVGGSDRFDVDFGYTGSGVIGDFVFLDVDGDGVQDPEDNGLANVSVNVLFAGADGLFGNDDDLTFTTVTDANGMYSFNNMPGGNFQVEVDTADPDLPGSISGVSGPQSNSGLVTLALADSETNNDIDFGFAGTLTLGDRLWFDGNGDGFQDVLNEPGFANVEVTLDYAGQDGIFGTTDDVSLTDTTDANGNYSFSNLADGEHRITYNSADLPAGMTGTHEVDDSAAAIDGTANITLNGLSRDEVDFGFSGAGSIGDFVFFDVNGDGVQDPSEPGLANITVDLEFAGTDGLFGTGDDFALQTTTDANGLYGFNNLADGNYRIVVDVVDADMPGSLTPVAGAESIIGTANVTLDAINGRSQSDIDFGFVGTNNVGDFVWFDSNGNGNQDIDEPGFGNVDVTLTYAGQDGIFGNADDVSLATTTDANGGYNFGLLPDGDYRVALDTGDLPTGMSQTAETNDGIDTLANTAEFSIGGADRDDIDFGYTGALTIGDTIYYDVNADGNEGVGEPGIDSVDVTLSFAGADGVFGNADDFVLTTTTDASGTYGFANLPEGEYELTLDGSDLPSGMNVITEEHDDTGAANDGTATVSLSTAGGDNNNVDFGFSGSQNLGDFVWFDVDGNGVQDAGEPGLGDVQVTLLFAGQDGTFGTPDDVAMQTTTDSNGAYTFTNLADGNYQVSINNSDLPAGMNQTAETDDGPNSIAGTAEVSISGADRTDIDFGYQGSGSISDFAWYDANGNGLQDVGEPGLPNASVQLTSAGENGIFGDADDFILNTTTDQNGLYSFDNLPASDYRVDLTGEPGGMTQTAETDDGANAIPGVAEVQLAVGEIQDNVDFGFVGAGSIGDTIFFDQDGNGVQDASEVGLPDVTVELQIDFDGDGTFDHTVTTLTDANGNYLFGNLPASDYIVTVTQPVGTNQTADPDGTLDNVATLTLADGENNMFQNFGYQGTGSIGDTVFWDQDADGIHDASEIGMSGVAVDLDIDFNSDGIVDHTLSTTTDANGQYSFGNLPAGSYTVRVTQPAGTTPTSDADGLGSTNQSTHNLTAGENNIDQDFGYRGNGSIGDTIFFDYLGDGGSLNPGENDRGMAGVDVTLEIDVDGDGSIDLTRVETTDANGNFSFDNLIDGDYTITVDSGDLPDAMGANPTFNSDVTIDNTTDVTLAVNEVNNDIDFGYHAAPDYTITKDDGLSDVVPGQTITYTISLTNNGTHRGQNVVVTDSYPTSILENVAATVNGVPGGIVDPVAGTVTWNLASVGMGEVVTLTVTADVIDPLASGITGLSNDVNVGDDEFNGVDPNPGDNFDDDVDTVTAQPDYQMIKSNDLSGPAVPGQTFNYFLQVVNSGNQDGTGVVVTDTLPIHILDSFSVVTDDPANVTYDPVTGDLVWNVGSLAGGGGARTLMVTVTVQDPVSTLMASFNNTANVTDDGANGADPNMADNSSTNSAGLDATPDYQIVKASSLTDTAFVGGTFEYTITVTNIGDQDGTGVTVNDFLPVSVINRFDVTTDDPANVTYDSATGELNWDVGALNGRGGTSTLTISVSIPFVVEDILADEIVNSATVTDDGLNGPDPDPTNNISTVTDPFLSFAFDSFNNFSTSFDQNQVDLYGREHGEHARMLRPIPVDPIFSGLAEPGTTLSLKIYDDEGNIIGERQVVADASGNWLANFPNTVIWKDPHRMDVEQTAPIQGSVDEVDGFNMRRYFHPATHHSLYFTERDTVSTVMRNTAYETIESMHAANNAPLQVGWRNHLYQLNVSSTNVSSK